MAADDSKSLEVARRMFARRFPDTDLKKKSQRNDGYGRLQGKSYLSAKS